MGSPRMQKAALVTREAHQALLDLKKLVDTATQKTHAAELETVGHGSQRFAARRCSDNHAQLRRSDRIARFRSCRVRGTTQA
jgi:hypothetical protein